MCYIKGHKTQFSGRSCATCMPSCDDTVNEHGGSWEVPRELFSSVHFEAFLQQSQLLVEWNSILYSRVGSLNVFCTQLSHKIVSFQISFAPHPKKRKRKIMLFATTQGNPNIFFQHNVKGEVHSRMAIYFLYANKKFIQKYVIHQNFSFQRALNPYEIVP